MKSKLDNDSNPLTVQISPGKYSNPKAVKGINLKPKVILNQDEGSIERNKLNIFQKMSNFISESITDRKHHPGGSEFNNTKGSQVGKLQ